MTRLRSALARLLTRFATWLLTRALRLSGDGAVQIYVAPWPPPVHPAECVCRDCLRAEYGSRWTARGGSA